MIYSFFSNTYHGVGVPLRRKKKNGRYSQMSYQDNECAD